jgi:hypothetical protein
VRCDDFVRAYQEHMLPATRCGTGYRGLYLLIHPPSGKTLFLSLWDTPEDALAYEASAWYRRHFAVLREYLKDQPVSELYDVDLQA